MKTSNPEALLPLTPAVSSILVALADGEKHGYAIMREVARQTEGTVKMGPGTLYGSIDRMLQAGLVEETESRLDSERDDQRRRYYRITPFGKRVLRAELERMSKMLRGALAKKLIPQII